MFTFVYISFILNILCSACRAYMKDLFIPYRFDTYDDINYVTNVVIIIVIVVIITFGLIMILLLLLLVDYLCFLIVWQF